MAPQLFVNYLFSGLQMCSECPDKPELRAFFQSPDTPTNLTLRQQVLAMDKLLEAAEVELRTLCDLIRYQQLKRLGVVRSVQEFMDLFRTDTKEDLK